MTYIVSNGQELSAIVSRSAFAQTASMPAEDRTCQRFPCLALPTACSWFALTVPQGHAAVRSCPNGPLRLGRQPLAACHHGQRTLDGSINATPASSEPMSMPAVRVAVRRHPADGRTTDRGARCERRCARVGLWGNAGCMPLCVVETSRVTMRTLGVCADCY